MNKKNILVVASHPDDKILGCGGSIDKYSKLGYKIYTLILGSGIDSRNLKKNTLKDKKILNSQCIKANRTLGVKKIFFENLSDNSFDNYNLLKIVKIIESYLKKIKPIIVFTHNKHDLNIDHRITFESTLTACRPLNESSVKRLLCFEIASSTEWAFGSFSNSFKPNFFIDIEKNIKNKIKSLKFYKSELRKYPHPRSLKNIENLSMIRGASVGLKNAEAFECIYNIS